MRNIFKYKDERHVGIYFLFHEHKLVYIGKTINLFNRIYQHGFKWDTVRLINCDKSKLDYYEKKFIVKYRPLHNRTYLFKVVSRKWNADGYSCVIKEINLRQKVA